MCRYHINNHICNTTKNMIRETNKDDYELYPNKNSAYMLKNEFPIFQNLTGSKPLIYLDSASTTQKPVSVINAMEYFYTHNNANIHRSVYKLAEQATKAYEQARQTIATFINAKNTHEIIFVKGTTEAINLVAASYGGQNFRASDEILISTLEHHSNIIPWQLICEKTGAILKVIRILENGELDLEHFVQLLNKRTKLVAITHVSNTLGTINPIKKIIVAAHAQNIPVLVDGAQAPSHFPIDVQDLDCDFYVFSAHKMYGPTGIGVLYGKEKFLESMPPYQSGGDMIKRVTFTQTEYANLPQKFEAGTPNIASVIGFGAAICFINRVGYKFIVEHDRMLLNYATKLLADIPNLKIIGNAKEKAGIISFILDDIHPHEVATILDTEGIAIRAGHHCTMPLMDFYHLPGTNRISFGIYNTKEEIDALALAIEKVRKFFI